MAGTGLQGAYALQSLDDLLRQRILDRREAEKVKEQIRQFDETAGERARQHDLETGRHTLALAQRGDVLEATKQQREAENVRNFVESAIPGEVEAPMAQRLRAQGYGGMLRTRPEQQAESGAGVLRTAPGALQPRLYAPEQTTLPQGGTRYQESRQRAGERQGQVEFQEGERTERAREAATARAGQEGIMNAIRQGTLAVQQGGLDLRREAQAEKLEGVRDKQEAAESTQREMGAAGLETLSNLLTPEGELTPGTKARVGLTGKIPAAIQSLVPGIDSRAAEAALKQLVGKETLAGLMALRRSSPTGGALGNVSDKDIAILQNAATILGERNLPEDVVRQELKRVLGVYQKMAVGERRRGAGRGEAAPGASSPASQTDPLGIR